MWKRGQGRGDNKVKRCLELLRADLILALRRARLPSFALGSSAEVRSWTRALPAVCAVPLLGITLE